MKLGTVLPDRAQLSIADSHADRLRSAALEQADRELSGLQRRTVGGEVRYYKTDTIYTPAISRGGVRRWFEVRSDGDYAIHND